MREGPTEKAVPPLLDGRYRILRKLGEGPVGTVFEASDVDTLEPVIVKILQRHWAGDAGYVRRLREETQALMALNHANIVRVLDLGRLDHDPPFLVSEPAGRPLSSLLDRGKPLAGQRLVPVLYQTLSALAAAHRAGIVHRGLKPENVLIEEDEITGQRIRICDFGVARHDDDGQPLGPIAYLAPEQLAGERVDGRADLFAVGVIAIESITGRAVAPPDVELLDERSGRLLASLRGLGLSDRFVRVVSLAVARDPLARYGDADAMRAALLSVPVYASDSGYDVTPFARRDDDS